MARSLEKELLTLNLIGHVESLFTFKNGTPRQSGICPNARGTITISKEIFNNPQHSLEGLQTFSHIWIIFIFHKNNNSYVKAKVKPPRLDGRRVGLFSTRSPYRPNPVGLTLAKLDRVEGCKLHISGIDLLDGTPVIDIKPYIPDYDCPNGVSTSALIPADMEHDVLRRDIGTSNHPEKEYYDGTQTSTKSLCDDTQSSTKCFSDDTQSSTKCFSDDTQSSTKCFSDDTPSSTKYFSDDIQSSTKCFSDDTQSSTKCFSDDTQSSTKCLSDDTQSCAKCFFDDTQSSTKCFSDDTQSSTKCLSDDTQSSTKCLSDDTQSSTKCLSDHTQSSTKCLCRPENKCATQNDKVTNVDHIEANMSHYQSTSHRITETEKNFVHDDDFHRAGLSDCNKEEHTVTKRYINSCNKGDSKIKLADWVLQPPTSNLIVRFTSTAERQLAAFTKNCQDPHFTLQYLCSAEEAREAVCSILRADPRSVYRRRHCRDQLYYFTVDVLHVTCWFDEDFVEVLRIKPVALVEHCQVNK